MKACYLTLFFFFFLLLSKSTFCQEAKKIVYQGQARGIVRDSVHNHILELASIAIYKVYDSTLFSYQLSNSFGEFQFKGVPENTKLKLMVSYTGYNTVSKTFIIPKKEGAIDLGVINLERKSIELSEVTIKYVPPVRMNGDTLEFNADAFNLDKNAVAEDFLKKLPRLTVWGDGTITVNGKQVKQLLVNGRPFFGGDTKVAIQNIPKDAIDKVQVYKEQLDKKNPLDSAMSLNIKLKKDKTNALFGKLSLGYGTIRRYDSDANLNFLFKNTQLSILAASNNVNKQPENVSMLLRNSTFKGIGASIDYQPDFRLPGINKSRAIGFFLQHDFIPNVNYNHTSRLKTEYFDNSTNHNTESDLQTITNLGIDSTQHKLSNEINRNDSKERRLKLNYERRKTNFSISSTAAADDIISNSGSISQISLFDSKGGLQSASNSDLTNEMTNKKISIDVSLSRVKDVTKINRLPGNWDIHYVLAAESKDIDKSIRTSFMSESDFAENRIFDRRYDQKENIGTHNLSLSLGDFSRLIFGNKGLVGISFGLRNELSLTTATQNSIVTNQHMFGVSQIDPYLTNASKRIIRDETLGLAIGRTFVRDLPNRYQQLLFVSFDLKTQFYNQQNNASQVFQNLKRDYQKFLPEASISYTNDQYGEFTKTYSLSFETQVAYPTVDQLSPIVDNINQYYIAQGNLNLREATDRKVSLGFDYLSQRMKNKFSYDAELSAGIIANGFADSTIVDELGRSNYYPINLNGNRYLKLSATLNKALTLNKNQLQVQFTHSSVISRNPGYINTNYIVLNTSSNQNAINLYYTLNDWLAINIRESLFLYRSTQSSIESIKFKSSTQSTMFSTSVKLNRRINVSSNITYNVASSTGSEVSNFNIWNASAAYRMLKANNLELKLTALDILRQNTSIINKGLNNSIIRGTTNVLRQYFIVSLAYFPRKFGKNKQSKLESEKQD